VERKLERLAEERKKGGGRERSVIEREAALFERFKDALSREIPLREIDLSLEDEKSLAGFGFLTRKPMLVLLNLHEGQDLPPVEYVHPHAGLVALQGKLEMELAQLDPADAEVFMAEYGISELGLARVIRVSYDLLGLISFFTVGQDEVRAWTLQRGLSAFDAAGEIHSDLQKGFIRAEAISYDELIALGGLNEAKAKGRLRLEGKEYVVHDGEIVHIRFNI
jgi:ribosome-binding ATPase YchF (GTP1/OBG family)